jgi:hypothetical protein
MREAFSVMVALALVVVLVGCGSARSGQRLTVTTWAGEDGSAEHAAFWDTQRQEHCAFRDVGPQEPDVTRCIPDFAERLAFAGWVNPDCTGDFATWAVDGVKVVRLLSDGRFYGATTQVPIFYEHEAGSLNGPCVPFGGSVPAPYFVWEEIPPASFVKASLAP